MAKVSTLLLSAATLAYLKLAPPHLQAPLVDVLSKYSPIAPSTIFNLASIYAAFRLCAGLLSNINAYYSRKVQNNWVEDTYDWNKEVVLLTGASSGLGEKMAIQLAEKGVQVIAMDVNPLNEATSKYSNIHFYKCDIGDFSQLSTVASEIRTAHGAPTVLILNAAIANLSPLLKVPLAKSQKLIDVNLTSCIAMMHEFLPSMIEKNHGHVLFVASMCSYLSIAGLTDYSASKAGMLGLYEALRVELRHVYKAPKVRMSIVHPTWMRTNIVEFNKVETDGSIREQRRLFWPLDKSAKKVVDAVMSGYGGRVIVPDAPILRAMLGLRLWPIWAQEGFRDYVRLH
ncbi:hypothetical protein H072_3696 [Dactylellina haptotyla CBS 200.50]|uniref:Uncharacterized protein n=1 Tax=Dactylellina haptotyla (strain CBS 200.50) TaxID=1284197 RepID=S8AMM2_DACHA|nr:hypothetical protein H072_3696 [Dactylellina haptotyla CBS 200.50]